MNPDLSQLPQFGLYHLSLSDAGLLIAKCLWFRGEIDVAFKRAPIVDFKCRELSAALNSQALKYTNVLIKAVRSGSLNAAQAKYDLDEKLQPRSTYVEAFTLAAWLEARDIILGDVFEDEYLSNERDLASRLSGLMQAERFAQSQDRVSDAQQLQDGAEMLFLRHELAKLEMELDALKRPQAHYHPITEKQKSAYLNIIGALLGLLLGTSPSGAPYSKFNNQQAVIDGIEANFGSAPGLSPRNLQDKFAQAKRQIVETTTG